MTATSPPKRFADPVGDEQPAARSPVTRTTFRGRCRPCSSRLPLASRPSTLSGERRRLAARAAARWRVPAVFEPLVLAPGRPVSHAGMRRSTPMSPPGQAAEEQGGEPEEEHRRLDVLMDGERQHHVDQGGEHHAAEARDAGDGDGDEPEQAEHRVERG